VLLLNRIGVRSLWGRLDTNRNLDRAGTTDTALDPPPAESSVTALTATEKQPKYVDEQKISVRLA